MEATSDGEQALALMRAEPFDLLILDMLLPGMNGFDVLQALRRVPRAQPRSLDMLLPGMNAFEVLQALRREPRAQSRSIIAVIPLCAPADLNRVIRDKVNELGEAILLVQYRDREKREDVIQAMERFLS